MRYVTPIGRVAFSLIFMMTPMSHFTAGAIGYAGQAGVPMPGLLVPFSGLLACAGGLSVALGYKARIGAWLLVLFLVPVTFMMHAFWSVADPMMRQLQMAMFMKNISMLGGALLITQFGAGAMSLDARRSAV
jgi:putative oxidoreductase